MLLIKDHQSIFEVYTWNATKIVLGKGAYATVYCCKHNGTKKKYAIKHFTKARSNSSIYNDVTLETEITKRLCHRNVVEFVAAYECKNDYYIVFTLYTGGELFEEITKKGKYTEKEGKIVMKQLFEAVYYLHSNGVIHRDIKPENIIYESKNEDALIKLIDFGVSQLFDASNPDTEFTAFIASKYYVAPEMLIKPTSYTIAVDCWSIGVIGHILLTGYPPYDGKTAVEVYTNIRDTEYRFTERDWSDFSKTCISFIKKLLQRNPQLRMSSTNAISHQWLGDRFLQRYSTSCDNHAPTSAASENIFKTEFSEGLC